MSKKLLVVGILITSLVISSKAQDKHSINIIPPSPTASSLGKYGEVPVGHYTGIPQIAIPIYDVKEGSLSCPVSLSYYGGGVKVEEISSWVGLGWSLRAGGVISRSVRGLPDESGSFFLPGNNLTGYLAGGQPGFPEFLRGIERQTEDGESDIYTFSVGDMNGSFFYDQSGNIHALPLNKTRIEKNATGWLLTAVNGDKYYFEAKEYAVTERACEAGAATPIPNVFNASPTSWYLTSIVSANSADSLKFEYDDYISNHDLALVETRYQLVQYGGPLCTSSRNSNCRSFIKTYGKRLTRILFRNGSVNFRANTARVDLSGDKRLDMIEVLNGENTLVKKYQFYYSYSISQDQVYPCNVSQYPTLERLKLDSLAEASATGAYPPYKFFYESTLLPCRNSFARDHWGYYNGANNTTLVPTFIYNQSGQTYTYPGANREANPTYAKAGTLNKITYPTGGSTLFEFENNTIWESSYIENPVNMGASVSVGADPVQSIYQDNFIIDIPPNSLNDNLGGAKVNITVNETLGDGRIANTYLEKLDANGNRLSIINFDNGFLADYRLENGIYRLKAEMPLPLSTNLADYDFFGVFMVWQEPGEPTVVSNNKPVGGLRIKKVQDVNADGAVARTRTFSYNYPNNQSSGGMFPMTEYVRNSTEQKVEQSPLPGTAVDIYNCVFKIRQAYTNLPLTQTSGGYVGYQYVTVSEAGNGYSTYEFTNPTTNPDETYPNFPYAPSTSFEWQRGLLVRQRDFAEGGTSPLRSVRNVYNILTPLTKSFSGITAGRSFITDLPNDLLPEYTVYSIITEFPYLNVTYDTLFDKNNSASYIATTQTNEYNPKNLLVKKEKKTNSRNEEITAEYRYPVDYSDSVMQGTIGMLKQKNIISPVVFLSNLRNGAITGGNINMLNSDGEIAKVYNFESSSTIPMPVLDSNILNPAPGNFRLSSELSYDQRKRLNLITSPQNHSITYIWDYKNAFAVAEFRNAEKNEVAYTSFESDGTGNWNINATNIVQGSPSSPLPTGKKYYNLTAGYPATKTSLINGNEYIVSYWRNNSAPFTISGASLVQNGYKAGRSFNGWTYHEHHVKTNSTSVTITGSGGIDELRLYPATSTVRTITYDPLIGVTSECDTNGRISYYEYDNFGKLKLVRDQDGKILKQIDLKYQVSATQ
ncbi:hypothetical protein [Chitinophaga sp. 22620]|uniref:hypothetical protein n=1 Tax=Chitinophaga sp. 22620 TaxID=3453952 RepID=UPI003F876F96